ncbi:sensor histidine kinase [Sphingobacterium sp. BS-2]|uniref:sensor histidine kinase n=1 Tax=Sphingobacterium sp. BS-2 TaxID=3377129 RepID=UPI0038FCB741
MTGTENLLHLIKKMHKKGEAFLSTKHKRIITVVSALVLLYLVSYLLNPYAEYWNTYFQRSRLDIFLDWGSSFAFCFAVSESSLIIGSKLNYRIKWTEKPLKRFFVETALNFMVVLFFLFLFSIMYIVLGEEETGAVTNTSMTVEETRDILQWILVSFVIAFAIIGVNTGDYLIENWKQTAVAAAQSKQAAMEAELHALKLQLDPHFVFNNLSVLSEIILKDQQAGHLYAENFAKIYRYLLIHSSKDLIALDEEVKFLNAYAYLLKQRIGEGVAFEMKIDPTYAHLRLPPLTLQMLVENALKHNKTIRNTPLTITIRSTPEKKLVIQNNMNLIDTQVPSSGIGLKNIIERYNLLQAPTPTIDKNQGVFSVTIPLIK